MSNYLNFTLLGVCGGKSFYDRDLSVVELSIVDAAYPQKVCASVDNVLGGPRL